jgi:ADP-heptose:LPS heptosyltransferase
MIKDKTIALNIQMPESLGDCLMATPAVKRLCETTKYPINLIVTESQFCIFKNFPGANLITTKRDVPGYFISLSGQMAYEAGLRLSKNTLLQTHHIDGFANILKVELDNHHLILGISDEETKQYKNNLIEMSGGKKTIICFPYALCCHCYKNEPCNKMIPFTIWAKTREYLESLGYYVLFLSSNKENKNETTKEEIIGGNWKIGFPLIEICQWLKECDCVIALDSAGGHLAAALDCNIVHLNFDYKIEKIGLIHTRGKYYLIDKYDKPSLITSEDIVCGVLRIMKSRN